MNTPAAASPPAKCDLRNSVRYSDGALSQEFCAQLVENFEKAAHLQLPHGKGHQAGLDSSGWTELNVGRVADAAFLGFFHAQIDKYLAEYNSELGLTLPIPQSSRPPLSKRRFPEGYSSASVPRLCVISPFQQRQVCRRCGF